MRIQILCACVTTQQEGSNVVYVGIVHCKWPYYYKCKSAFNTVPYPIFTSRIFSGCFFINFVMAFSISISIYQSKSLKPHTNTLLHLFKFSKGIFVHDNQIGHIIIYFVVLPHISQNGKLTGAFKNLICVKINDCSVWKTMKCVN